MIRVDQPVHRTVRTMHAGYVLVTLFVTSLLLLGTYEAIAAYVNPSASILFSPEAAEEPEAATALWLQVEVPSQAYWPDDTPAWTALPGEVYRIVIEEDGWALAFAEGGPPQHQVWIKLDPWVTISDTWEGDAA
jgi:hypothetical protein